MGGHRVYEGEIPVRGYGSPEYYQSLKSRGVLKAISERGKPYVPFGLRGQETAVVDAPFPEVGREMGSIAVPPKAAVAFIENQTTEA